MKDWVYISNEFQTKKLRVARYHRAMLSYSHFRRRFPGFDNIWVFPVYNQEQGDNGALQAEQT